MARARDAALLKGPWYLPRDPRYRRRLRATREGKLFLFVTFGLGFAAINTGTNLMYLIFGFMLSLIIFSGVLSEQGLRRLRVTRRLPSRAVAGQPCLVEVVICNQKKRMVSYSLEAEDIAQGQANDRRCYFLKVAPGAEQVASYRRVPGQRGVMRFVMLKVLTRFPFALFEKWRELPEVDELIVFPSPLAVPLPAGLSRDAGEQAGTARGRGAETRELRDYRSDDEVRAIHWKRSASFGRPIVRELEREAAPVFCIQLDNFRPADARPDWEARFERDVSRASYLVEQVFMRGYAVEVCARGSRSPRAVQGMLDPPQRFLALVAPTAEAVPFAPPAPGAQVIDLRTLGEPPREGAA
jgi:uncharacterized protein (DUF58 family)